MKMTLLQHIVDGLSTYFILIVLFSTSVRTFTSINHELDELLYNRNGHNNARGACTTITVPYGNSAMKCCIVKNRTPKEIKCYPSFIIAGVQKSGTTILSSYLASLASVAFATQKEVHYYDFNANYHKGINRYFSAFPIWNYTNNYYPPMYAESSPSYIVGHKTCERISRDIPDVKLIVLLREPIGRTYSEYNMAVRLYSQQERWMTDIYLHQKTLYSCMYDYRYLMEKRKDYVLAMKNCLPSVLTSSNSQFKKFMIRINFLLDKFKSVGYLLHTCFDSNTYSIDKDSSSSNADIREYDKYMNITIEQPVLQATCLLGVNKLSLQSLDRALLTEPIAFRRCAYEKGIYSSKSNDTYSKFLYMVALYYDSLNVHLQTCNIIRIYVYVAIEEVEKVTNTCINKKIH